MKAVQGLSAATEHAVHVAGDTQAAWVFFVESEQLPVAWILSVTAAPQATVDTQRVSVRVSVANKVTVGIVTSFVAYMLIVIVEPTLAHRGSGYTYCT
jgi:hypothetical protein